MFLWNFLDINWKPTCNVCGKFLVEENALRGLNESFLVKDYRELRETEMGD